MREREKNSMIIEINEFLVFRMANGKFVDNKWPLPVKPR